MSTTLDSLPGELVRAIVCLQPDTLTTLPFVNRALYAALLGPDVRDNESHWRAFVTQRRWPAYAHIEAGKYDWVGKTWKDLARGWRDLLPWHYVHVRNPHWASCGHLLKMNGYCSGVIEPCPCKATHTENTDEIKRIDTYYRIILPPLVPMKDEDYDGAIELFRPPRIKSYSFSWNASRRHVIDYCWNCGAPYRAAVPEDEIQRHPKWTAIFVGFV